MQEKLTIGIDVSKRTLDVYLKPSNLHFKLSNDAAGFKNFRRQIKSLVSENILIVMEHTGYYSLRLEKFLAKNGVSFCKIPALEIKRSLGVIRGKSDKIDARRIAEYGWLRRELLAPSAVSNDDIRQLRSLLNFRSKLVADRSGYITRLKEMIATGAAAPHDLQSNCQRQIITVLSQSVRKVEVEIQGLIKSNLSLQRSYQLLKSIKGVGMIVAAYMIAFTENFQKFKNARKFNCYAGLAPFGYESGTSIKGRSRVSHLANKQAKTLLNLAAASAIRHDQELKDYYQRRTSEGMKGMSCLNIVRSKIVARIFAVVKRQTPYEPIRSAA
jgi:transposase